jgi:hypothetical protein
MKHSEMIGPGIGGIVFGLGHISNVKSHEIDSNHFVGLGLGIKAIDCQ